MALSPIHDQQYQTELDVGRVRYWKIFTDFHYPKSEIVHKRKEAAPTELAAEEVGGIIKILLAKGHYELETIFFSRYLDISFLK